MRCSLQLEEGDIVLGLSRNVLCSLALLRAVVPDRRKNDGDHTGFHIIHRLRNLRLLLYKVRCVPCLREPISETRRNRHPSIIRVPILPTMCHPPDFLRGFLDACCACAADGLSVVVVSERVYGRSSCGACGFWLGAALSAASWLVGCSEWT